MPDHNLTLHVLDCSNPDRLPDEVASPALAALMREGWQVAFTVPLVVSRGGKERQVVAIALYHAPRPALRVGWLDLALAGAVAGIVAGAVALIGLLVSL